jgi:hypothetical protein
MQTNKRTRVVSLSHPAANSALSMAAMALPDRSSSVRACVKPDVTTPASVTPLNVVSLLSDRSRRRSSLSGARKSFGSVSSWKQKQKGEGGV